MLSMSLPYSLHMWSSRWRREIREQCGVPDGIENNREQHEVIMIIGLKRTQNILH